MSPDSNRLDGNAANDGRTSCLKRIALSVGIVIGLGISTVYRAGPYPVAAEETGVTKLKRWEKHLGFNLDKSGNRIWGSPVHRTDFTIYTAVGRAIVDHTDIYEAENPRAWHYNNAPIFGLVFVPLAMIPVFWAALIWYVVSVVVVAFAFHFSVKMLQPYIKDDQHGLWLYVVPPLLLIWPLMSALARGQMTPLLFALAMAGVYYQSRGRDWLGGAFLAGAVLMKIFPVFLLAYYVWRKRWKFIVATGVFVIVGACVAPVPFLGWERNLTFHREWVSILQRPVFEQGKSQDPRFGELISPDLVRNQSLQAVLKRMTSLSAPTKVVAVIGLAMAAVMIFAAARARDEDRWLLLSSMIAWALLMSPVSWSHYFMLLMLPVATMTLSALSDPDVRVRKLSWITLIVFGVMSCGAAGSRPAQVYGPLCWATVVLWAGLLAVSTMRSRCSRAAA